MVCRSDTPHPVRSTLDNSSCPYTTFGSYRYTALAFRAGLFSFVDLIKNSNFRCALLAFELRDALSCAFVLLSRRGTSTSIQSCFRTGLTRHTVSAGAFGAAALSRERAGRN
jgi:hypothetical protein